MKFSRIYGVDFSGAKLAGENIWIACIVPRGKSYELIELSRLRSLCGIADREPALAHLVELIGRSEQSLWGMDFPFGLPIEIIPAGASWNAQIRFVGQWTDANSLGQECCRRARLLGGALHLRRDTDREARTPFDCYHYRIIYQTFHGIRDVLGPIATMRGSAVLPFQYRKLPSASRVIVEACPGSTLKRWGLPHQNYKQPAGGPLTARRLQVRRAILEGLSSRVTISPSHRLGMMRNGGGDAIDAVLAAVGAAEAFVSADHRKIARHDRYPREGRLYV